MLLLYQINLVAEAQILGSPWSAELPPSIPQQSDLQAQQIDTLNELSAPLRAAPDLSLADESRPLSLDEAVARALAADDPAVRRFEARAAALDEEAVAAAQLPDPLVTAQMANVPTDSFRFDRDGMTQALRVGLRQEFPAGRTLALSGQERSIQADVQRAQDQVAERDLILDVRNAWFQRVLSQRAISILEHTRTLIAEQIESLQARFATGRLHAQDLYRVELELALIDDRLSEQRRQNDVAIAGLARYIGKDAWRRAPELQPTLTAPASAAELERALLQHPAVIAEKTQAEAADVRIRIAEQAYKPKFALEGGYGLRTARPDLATIGVTLSLPFFTNKRQDRRRAAAIQAHSAELLDHDLLLREYRRLLQEDLAQWQRLNERLALYRGILETRAHQTAEAAVTTYANSQTDFAELIRARLAELNVELQRVELEAQLGLVWARLQWLVGENV
ncbi:MAG: TolC family protein [Wenzhouxiangellaceae bacterium]